MWDQDLLDQRCAGSGPRLHEHSLGRTGPSLLQAIGVAASVSACAVSSDREVLDGASLYWSDVPSVARPVEEAGSDRGGARDREDLVRDRAALEDRDPVVDDHEAAHLRFARPVDRAAGRPSARAADRSTTWE